MALPSPLRVLVVDDELPAAEELAFLLRRDPSVGLADVAADASAALRRLQTTDYDAVFADIRMPGLSGLDLARVLARFARRPGIVFVTAHDEHAVDAFDLGAADYLLKPVRADRVAQALRRVRDGRGPAASEPSPSESSSSDPADETIPVELGGVTRFLRRSEIRYVEAQGDYARLHTAGASHLVRLPLTTLEERWADQGFVRIHRSTLVALHWIDEVHVADGRCSVRLGTEELQVSRRHTRELRDRLIRTTQR